MEIPYWKKWLSYLVEWHVESAPSPHNPHLYVSVSRGRYQLSTAKAIYSYGDLYDNFARTFKQMDFAKLPGDQVLLLGLGLGSVPFMLEKNFRQSFRYTAVEIDEAVVYLAHKYVLSGLHSPVEVVCADAFAYVAQCTDTYDLIAMDIFLDDIIPDEFQSEEFLRQLAALLNPGGVLLFNRLSRTAEDLSNTKVFYKDIFKKVFPDAAFLDVRGNWILVNNKNILTTQQP
jgi:SAM-dependent methyltransferase